MARTMPARAAPSPRRETSPANQPSASRVICSESDSTPPVRISAQVEAFTKKRLRGARVLRPLAVGELVCDQFVGRARVRHPEQGLGQAQERDALLVGETELLQEGVEQRPLVAAGAARLDQVPRPRHHPLALSHGQVDVGEEGPHGPGLVEVGRGANGLPQAAEPASLRIARRHTLRSRGYPGADAALRPAVRPNTAPDVRPVPPG